MIHQSTAKTVPCRPIPTKSTLTHVCCQASIEDRDALSLLFSQSTDPQLKQTKQEFVITLLSPVEVPLNRKIFEIRAEREGIVG